ncbi:MAG TPA: hypothetical protein DDZ51_30480 [Planctomycetaceae bacterium]|nr:hypothetical protein [Planctomycetaceae bacterium]
MCLCGYLGHFAAINALKEMGQEGLAGDKCIEMTWRHSNAGAYCRRPDASKSAQHGFRRPIIVTKSSGRCAAVI